MHNAQFSIVHRGNFGLHRCKRLGRLIGAIPQGLAGAIIDHGDHDIRQSCAVFFLQGGVGKCRQQHRRRQAAQPPTGQAAPQGGNQQQHSHRNQSP